MGKPVPTYFFHEFNFVDAMEKVTELLHNFEVVYVATSSINDMDGCIVSVAPLQNSVNVTEKEFDHSLIKKGLSVTESCNGNNEPILVKDAPEVSEEVVVHLRGSFVLRENRPLMFPDDGGDPISALSPNYNDDDYAPADLMQLAFFAELEHFDEGDEVEIPSLEEE